MTEAELETQFIAKLQDLKYSYRRDIRTRAALEDNFRRKFDELNWVTLELTRSGGQGVRRPATTARTRRG